MSTTLNKEQVLNFIHDEMLELRSQSKTSKKRFKEVKNHSNKDMFYEGADVELRILNAAINSGRFDSCLKS